MNEFQKNTYQLNNVQAERELISACIIDDDIYQSVASNLSEELFTDYESRKVYGIIRQIEREGKKIDATDVAMRIASIGGNIGLFITTENVSYEMTKQRAELLYELSLKRKLFGLCNKGISIATDPTATMEDFQKLLYDMSNQTSGTSNVVQSFGDTLRELRKDMVERKDLGHSRTYTTADEPDVLHVMESQSDWAQSKAPIIGSATSVSRGVNGNTVGLLLAGDGCETTDSPYHGEGCFIILQ